MKHTQLIFGIAAQLLTVHAHATSCSTTGLNDITTAANQLCEAVSEVDPGGDPGESPAKREIKAALLKKLKEASASKAQTDIDFVNRFAVKQGADKGKIDYARVSKAAAALEPTLKDCPLATKGTHILITNATKYGDESFQTFDSLESMEAAKAAVDSGELFDENPKTALLHHCTSFGTEPQCNPNLQKKWNDYSSALNAAATSAKTVPASDVFKANSADFNAGKLDAIKAQASGVNRKVNGVSITTCSSLDRNCAGADANTDACRFVKLLRAHSDQELISNVVTSPSKYGLSSAEAVELRDVLSSKEADRDYGYASNAARIDQTLSSPSNGFSFKNDNDEPTLREWLFLSALRGKRVGDALKKDPAFKDKKITYNPLGNDDSSGFGFSNQKILPGTCGNILAGDQFFGKYCGDANLAGSCSKADSKRMAIAGVCAGLHDKYEHNADYSDKVKTFMEQNHQSKPDAGYSMARTVYITPQIEENETIAGLLQPGAPGAPQEKMHCQLECSYLKPVCSTLKGRQIEEKEIRIENRKEFFSTLFPKNLFKGKYHNPLHREGYGCPVD